MSDDTEIVNLLTEIDMREKNLSRTSDEFREAVKKIATQFGKREYCRVCGEHEKNAPHTNKKNPNYHEFVPAIYVSLFIIDTEPVYTYVDWWGSWTCYLTMRDSKLMILERLMDCDETQEVTHKIEDISRKHLLEIFNAGRLTAFLKIVAETLQRKDCEYREVAEIAKKFAKALED